ncbi:MAG: aminotransferase class I/II-fold pyridoxal phosphate-dependent enzyme [Dysosmobacter sp.]|nr:aminotransferase class I/II-fold pyridoxal phosphate-dependent enzyme [Dysosmobacter sp.]
MKIDDFTLENWLNPACDSEKNKIYLGGSCVLPMTVEELFQLTGESMEDFFQELRHMDLGYGRFDGTPRTRRAIAEKLYRKVEPEEVILCHGGTGANSTVCYALIESRDNVISIMPNYQQFFSIPKSIGAEVRKIDLKPEAGYRLDIEEVRRAVDQNTKAILFTNPNNPTGSLLTLEEMQEIVEIARSVDAWVICDEMYRGLKEEYMPSFADLYEKAIVTASSSKIYSMAGTRVGWIICHDPDTRFKLFNWRSYDSICGGVFDEWIFAIALEHVDKIFQRSRRIVSANKAVIDKWIADNPYLHQYADSYATTCLVHYDLEVPAEEFCDGLLDQKGVLVCHGDCFNIPHSFRITLSHAHDLEKGLRLIDEYIEELVSQGKAMKN